MSKGAVGSILGLRECLWSLFISLIITMSSLSEILVGQVDCETFSVSILGLVLRLITSKLMSSNSGSGWYFEDGMSIVTLVEYFSSFFSIDFLLYSDNCSLVGLGPK